MSVIADTSVISYLLLIQHHEILPHLYGRIILPTAVHLELRSPCAPVVVQDWAAHLPAWADVVTPASQLSTLDARLGSGEREAISLALELDATLLIDDRLARESAEHYGCSFTGTLGILRDAHALGLLDLTDALNALRSTSFRVSPALMNQLLADARSSQ